MKLDLVVELLAVAQRKQAMLMLIALRSRIKQMAKVLLA